MKLNKFNIFLIEDDIKLKKYICDYLEAYEYKVAIIDDFDNIMDEILVKYINIILIKFIH